MTRRRKPLVAHVVMMSLVLDPALAARIATPTGAEALPSVDRPPAVHPMAPPMAAFSPPPALPPPAAAATEECEDALDEGRAPASTLSRTHLWPPNHALIDVG